MNKKPKSEKIKLISSVKYAFIHDIDRRALTYLILVAAVLKLILTACQMVQIFPGEAPIDDELMFNAANSIKEGNWLGAYSWFTIAKHMFFSVWLWLLNLLHIPYLIGGQLLYFVVCVVMMNALSPVLKKRLHSFFAFLVLWFSPYSWAQFTLRVYIDNIYPSLCLLFFAGVIGVCLRINKPVKYTIAYAVAAGIGLGLSWLTKDDAVWILPFGICATLIYFVFALLKKEGIKKTAARIAVPLIAVGIFFGCTTAYKAMNYKYYGRFVISDYTSKEFKDAISALVRADTDIPHKHVLLCENARQKVYAKVSSFEKLSSLLETQEYKKGFGTDEYNSAGIIWAIRKTAFDAGLADTAPKAEQFYESLSREINDAFEDGKLASTNKNILSGLSATLIPYDNVYLAPTAKETLSSLGTLLFFKQTSSLAPLSYASVEQAKAYEDFIFTRTSYSAVAGTNEADYYPWNVAAEIVFQIIVWIYRILVWAVLFFGFWRLGKDIKKTLAELRKREFSAQGLMTVVALGVLLSALLRIVMISYIEVSSFCIGTYLLYLAPAGAILLVFYIYGFIPILEGITKLIKKKEKQQ